MGKILCSAALCFTLLSCSSLNHRDPSSSYQKTLKKIEDQDGTSQRRKIEANLLDTFSKHLFSYLVEVNSYENDLVKSDVLFSRVIEKSESRLIIPSSANIPIGLASIAGGVLFLLQTSHLQDDRSVFIASLTGASSMLYGSLKILDDEDTDLGIIRKVRINDSEALLGARKISQKYKALFDLSESDRQYLEERIFTRMSTISTERGVRGIDISGLVVETLSSKKEYSGKLQSYLDLKSKISRLKYSDKEKEKLMAMDKEEKMKAITSLTKSLVSSFPKMNKMSYTYKKDDLLYSVSMLEDFYSE